MSSIVLLTSNKYFTTTHPYEATSVKSSLFQGKERRKDKALGIRWFCFLGFPLSFERFLIICIGFSQGISCNLLLSKTKVSSLSFISLKWPNIQMVSLWGQKFTFLCNLLLSIILACVTHICLYAIQLLFRELKKSFFVHDFFKYFLNILNF